MIAPLWGEWTLLAAGGAVILILKAPRGYWVQILGFSEQSAQFLDVNLTRKAKTGTVEE
jgi:hypothetical protein